MPVHARAAQEAGNRRAKAQAKAPLSMNSYNELPLNAETITKRRAEFGRDAWSPLSVDVKKQLQAVVRALARSAAIAEHKTAENEREDQT